MHACLGLSRWWSCFFLAILLCRGQPLPTAETASCCASRVKQFLPDPLPCILGWVPFVQIQGKYVCRPKSKIGRANHMHSHKNHHGPVTEPPAESLPLSQAILQHCIFTLVPCVYGQSNVFPNPCLSTWLTCLPGWALKPVENFAPAHCWWHAHADVTGQAPDTAMWLLRSSTWLLTPETSAYQIQVIVSLLWKWYPTGLLVLHHPAMCCFLFFPGKALQVLSFEEAAVWKDSYPQTPATLLYETARKKAGGLAGCG